MKSRPQEVLYEALLAPAQRNRYEEQQLANPLPHAKIGVRGVYTAVSFASYLVLFIDVFSGLFAYIHVNKIVQTETSITDIYVAHVLCRTAVNAICEMRVVALQERALHIEKWHGMTVTKEKQREHTRDLALRMAVYGLLICGWSVMLFVVASSILNQKLGFRAPGVLASLSPEFRGCIMLEDVPGIPLNLLNCQVLHTSDDIFLDNMTMFEFFHENIGEGVRTPDCTKLYQDAVWAERGDFFSCFPPRLKQLFAPVGA
jgi:hypothetical protein